jgi:hypothetical protein
MLMIDMTVFLNFLVWQEIMHEMMPVMHVGMQLGNWICPG